MSGEDVERADHCWYAAVHVNESDSGDTQRAGEGIGIADAVSDRREVVAALGAVLRAAVAAAIRTEVSADELRRVADPVGRAVTPLNGRLRTAETVASADDLSVNLQMFNPVSGAGNP